MSSCVRASITLHRDDSADEQPARVRKVLRRRRLSVAIINIHLVDPNAPDRPTGRSFDGSHLQFPPLASKPLQLHLSGEITEPSTLGPEEWGRWSLARFHDAAARLRAANARRSTVTRSIDRGGTMVFQMDQMKLSITAPSGRPEDRMSSTRNSVLRSVRKFSPSLGATPNAIELPNDEDTAPSICPTPPAYYRRLQQGRCTAPAPVSVLEPKQGFQDAGLRQPPKPGSHRANTPEIMQRDSHHKRADSALPSVPHIPDAIKELRTMCYTFFDDASSDDGDDNHNEDDGDTLVDPTSPLKSHALACLARSDLTPRDPSQSPPTQPNRPLPNDAPITSTPIVSHRIFSRPSSPQAPLISPPAPFPKLKRTKTIFRRPSSKRSLRTFFLLGESAQPESAALIEQMQDLTSVLSNQQREDHQANKEDFRPTSFYLNNLPPLPLPPRVPARWDEIGACL